MVKKLMLFKLAHDQLTLKIWYKFVHTFETSATTGTHTHTQKERERERELSAEHKTDRDPD